MKAARIIEPGKVEVFEVARPEIGPEEVLIRVRALGLCGSDLNTYRGSNPLVEYPRIPGHEIAGEIVELGKKVSGELNVGQPVTISPYTTCGKCSSCKKGRANCCRYNQTMGNQRDGAAREYIAVFHKKVFPVEHLATDQIALIEPFSIGWHAVHRAQTDSSDTVLVFGCGVIGLGVIAALAYRKVRVIAVDLDDGKLMKARDLGAETIINASNENLEQKVDTITSGNGPDVVIEAVGSPGTYRQSVEIVGFSGKIVYIGYVKDEVCFETKKIVAKELDIKGSRNALDGEIADVIKLFQNGFVDSGNVITHRFILGQIGEAFSFWNNNPNSVIKILIDI